VKERPILFSGSMVRAILEGRKWQTRRVVKGAAGSFWDHKGWRPVVTCGRILEWETTNSRGARGVFGAGAPRPSCPYGAPGDRLWVRETWAPLVGGPCEPGNPVMYKATEPEADKWTWRPSIFMPRWASRITLEVTGVRVERLQEISRQDAKAEGLWPSPHNGLEMVNGRPYGNAQLAFRALWESINGQGSWDANPWVWVIEFQTWEVRG
jgi:hypothetical protein